jgi:copper(I)-binding protein
MKTLSTLTASLVAIAAMAAPAMARASHITVSAGWARQTVPGQNDGGGYLKISNSGSSPDRLTGVASPVSASAEVHSMTIDHGIMRMRPVVGGLVIPAHGSLELKPGGYHIMLIGLRHPLHVGETVKLRLRFDNAGEMPASLAVGPAGATGLAGPGMGNMDMSGMDMGHAKP